MYKKKGIEKEEKNKAAVVVVKVTFQDMAPKLGKVHADITNFFSATYFMIVDSSVSGFTVHMDDYLRTFRFHEKWNDIWTLIETKLFQGTTVQPICLLDFYPFFFAAAKLLLCIHCHYFVSCQS